MQEVNKEILINNLAIIAGQSIKLSNSDRPQEIAEEVLDAIDQIDVTGEFDQDAFIEAILNLAELGADQTDSPIDDMIVDFARNFSGGKMGIIGTMFQGWGARIKARRQEKKKRKAEKKANR